MVALANRKYLSGTPAPRLDDVTEANLVVCDGENESNLQQLDTEAICTKTLTNGAVRADVNNKNNSTSRTNVTLTDVFRSRQMTLRTLVVFYDW